jgi:hypothetical protein
MTTPTDNKLAEALRKIACFDDESANERLRRTGGDSYALFDEPGSVQIAREALREHYAKVNPLGGPATMFETIASRLRAGEEYHEVLHDYGIVDTKVQAISQDREDAIQDALGLPRLKPAPVTANGLSDTLLPLLGNIVVNAGLDTPGGDEAVEAMRAAILRSEHDTAGAFAKLRADNERLRAWLLRIDGGDNPCFDQAQLRRWAYEAVTLGHAIAAAEEKGE